MFNFLKKRKEQKIEKEIKKMNSSIKRNGELSFYTVYQDNNVKTIANELGLKNVIYEKNPEYDDYVDYIKSHLEKDKEDVLNFSTFINVYVFDKISLEDAFNVVSATKFQYVKLLYDKNQEMYYLLICGGIYDYKQCIRNVEPDNNVAKLVIQSMYELNDSYFRDFIQDEIMDKSLFNSYQHLGEEYHIEDVYEITPIDKISNILNKFGFSNEDAFRCGSVLFKSIGIFNFFDILLFEENGKFSSKASIKQCANKIKTMCPMYKEYSIPVYLRVKNDISGYADIDEIQGDIVETSYEKDENQSIFKDDEGNIIYNEDDYE